VFRGYDPDQDRVVAIKAFSLDLTPEQASDLAADLQRLSLIKIAHPFIIFPLGAGADGSTPYVVEEYFVADSADVALKQYGPAPLPDALRLIGQLAGALDAATAVGVHHGALHPRDVLVAPHEVRLTGLGVVPALERVGFRPQARRPYAAPERMAGGPITLSSDVFSLACIAFELVTGRRPVPSGDAVTVDTSAIKAADSAALAEVFARVLSATPADRHPSALAFAAALKHALTGEPLQVGAEIDSSRPRRAIRPHRIVPPPEPKLPIELGAKAPEPASPPLPSFLEEYEVIPPGGSESASDTSEMARAARTPAEIVIAPQPVAPVAVSLAIPPAVLDARPAPVVLHEPTVVPPAEQEPAPVADPMSQAEPLDRVLVPVLAPAPDVRQASVPMFSTYSDEPPREAVVALFRKHFVLMLGMLAVTFALGLAVGYFASPRDGRAASVAAAAAVPAPAASSALTPAPPAQATGAPGQPAAKPAPPQARRDTAPTTSAARPGVAASGTLVVSSKPSGARVLVDGHAVGTTPVTLRTIAPGSHKIRLELAGHRAWSSTVRVAAGRQRKVAASLDRRPGG
jgi:serine/threonine-protein kinase